MPRSVLFHGSLNSSLVGEVATTRSGSALAVAISQGTTVPETATHLLAFSIGASGESARSASSLIVDHATPSNPAAAVAFSDTDARPGFVGGNISVTRAGSEVRTPQKSIGN